MSLHSVFVLSVDGKLLTPTTPARARKLLSPREASATRYTTGQGRYLCPLFPGARSLGYAKVCWLDFPKEVSVPRRLKAAVLCADFYD
jgi:hypothetical protein